MKNHRIIQVKYLGPTNTRGSRIILTENRYNKTDIKILSFDHQFDSTVKQAESYLKSIGINLVGFGSFKDVDYIFSDSWAYDKGFININGEIE